MKDSPVYEYSPAGLLRGLKVLTMLALRRNSVSSPMSISAAYSPAARGLFRWAAFSPPLPPPPVRALEHRGEVGQDWAAPLLRTDRWDELDGDVDRLLYCFFGEAVVLAFRRRPRDSERQIPSSRH